jgi:hypothetical protein
MSTEAMGADGTTEPIAEATPRLKARIAGVFYLLNALTAVFSIVALGRLVVPGSAATTAANLLSNEPVFWLGFTAALINVACQIAWAALFYDVFMPVSKNLSLLAAFFLLMECVVLAFASLFQLAPMLVLGGAGYLSVFTREQLQALALMFLNLNTQAFNISLVFFGFFCLLIGYLIVRSTLMPRVLGVLYALAGVGYLTFLSPPLASSLSPFNLAPAALAEPSMILWLLIVGVNAKRWRDQASAMGVFLRG